MIARAIFGLTMGVAVIGGVLMASAGRWDHPWLWAYTAGWGLYAVVSATVAYRYNPELIAERMKPPSDHDRLTRKLALSPMLGHLVVAGLDVGRFGWSSVGLTGHLLGFAALTAGWGLVAWTFGVNKFASSAVRIQEDREHRVVEHGPYAIVRHPMYLGVLLTAIGSGPAVGSWWAGLAILPVIPIFIRRTRLEDRLLHEELPGYPEYAKRTRWRIIPGVY